MSSRLTPKGENSARAIVQAAYTLFIEKGYHGTSMREIAGQAGLTTGGVYAHFADKDAIFMAVLREFHPFWQILPALEQAEGDNAEALLHDMARRMIAALGAQRQALNLMFIEIVEFQGRHFAEMFPEYFPRVVAIFGRAAAFRGALRPLPRELLIRSFFGLCFSYFLSNVALANQLPSDDAALDQFVDVYIHGVMAGSGPAGQEDRL